MAFDIITPGTGDHVLVPASGMICACGDILDDDVWASSYVLVRVLSGWVDPPQSPWPQLSSDAKGSIVGQSWYATNVQLPSGSGTGGQITVAAWLITKAGSGSGVGTASAPTSNQCYAGGASPVDTCAKCSGSGGGAMLVGPLASVVELEITVPSGANAGAYRATAVSLTTWQVIVGGVPYRLVYAEGASLTIHGPSASAPSTSFEADPFSATFPGEIFDADDEIVVIVA